MPDWIWVIFTFAFGCCVGSFLNVVVYRLPKDKSLIKPPSSCPACGKHIRFYDNIPLVSYIVLGRKCRYCKAAISPRYFVIELATGLIFVATFYILFHSGRRAGVPPFVSGGWLLYLITIILLCALLASSAIDLELWIIPLSVCWFATVVGLVFSALGPLLIKPRYIRGYSLLPYASAKTAALAAGAAVGLGVSVILLQVGVLKRSYELDDRHQATEVPDAADKRFNHRLEMCHEIVFLLPIIACGVLWYLLTAKVAPLGSWWLDLLQQPVLAGLLGSLFGYFVGCGTVWATRILGTFAFGKEAMGLGDVHLMGAAGAITGPLFVVVAFFIAPFFGLGWALFQMFFKKTRQIPYGPFLSLGVFGVIILHDVILERFAFISGRF